MSQTRASRLKNLSFSATALRSKPELATRLAVILNEWTAVEGMACAVLGSLLQGPDEPRASKERLDAAATILGQINSFRLRIEIIRQMARVRLSGHAFDAAPLKALNDFLDFAVKAEGERNKVAHKIFGTCDNYPDALIGIDCEYLITGWDFAPDRIVSVKRDLECLIFSSKYLSEIEERMRQAQDKMLQACATLALHEGGMRAVRLGAAPPGPSGAESSLPDPRSSPPES
jgi:hypothetical protein